MANTSMLEAGESESDGGYSNKQRTCKICYGVDEDMPNAEWTAPCNCSGSIKWVHRECLNRWMVQAPMAQQSTCNTCKFPYKRCWTLKPIEKWSRPHLNLTTWAVIEILLDIYSTIKLVRNTTQTIQGRKSLFGQLCFLGFYKAFIMSSARIEYYRSLCRQILAAIFETSIIDAKR